MNETKKQLSHVDLMQFTGGPDRYQAWGNSSLRYTEGIKFLMKHGVGSFWLINAITSYFGSKRMREAMNRDERLRSLQFWRLDVHADQSATLSARADSGVEPFITQEIPFTDFPLDSVDVWAGFDGTHWTLYLPSEH